MEKQIIGAAVWALAAAGRGVEHPPRVGGAGEGLSRALAIAAGAIFPSGRPAGRAEGQGLAPQLTAVADYPLAPAAAEWGKVVPTALVRGNTCVVAAFQAEAAPIFSDT
jgi:hypothetical protein